MMAAYNGNEQVLRILLDYGYDASAVDNVSGIDNDHDRRSRSTASD
jgi:hypothetical protein